MCSNYLKYICQWIVNSYALYFDLLGTTFDCHWWGRIHTSPAQKSSKGVVEGVKLSEPGSLIFINCLLILSS